MKGFTLIEAMVAISILAIAVAAPMYAASRALVTAQNANNQLTASYLAQEGVEAIRLARDSQYIYDYYTKSADTSQAWSTFQQNIGALCTYVAGSKAGCSGEALGLQACGATCSPLNLTSSGQYTIYFPPGSTQTIYTRTITVSAPNSTSELVTSTVTWRSRGTTYTVAASDLLTRWQP